LSRKGKLLLSADYSQIELRIMAHFSKDPVLVAPSATGNIQRSGPRGFRRGSMLKTRSTAALPKPSTSESLRTFSLRTGAAIGIGRKSREFINAYFTRYAA